MSLATRELVSTTSLPQSATNTIHEGTKDQDTRQHVARVLCFSAEHRVTLADEKMEIVSPAKRG